MSKSFTHAGVSKLDGEFKVRFANDSMRTKVLIKNGHTDIDIVELKHAMTKEDAITYLLSINFDNGNKEVRAALEAEQTKREPKAANKQPKPSKEAKKPKKDKKVTMAGIEAKVAAKKAAPKSTVSKQAAKAKTETVSEDAPF